MSAPTPRRRRDPLRLYAFALREGDLRLAELIHRRLVRMLLTERIVRALRERLAR
jgi:hypothetical protein